MTEPNETRQPQPIKDLRNALIREGAAEGKTTVEMAKEFGLARQTVSKILNSDETKALIREAEERVKGLINKSIDRLEDAIENGVDGTNALKAAMAVLKSFGLLRETTEVSHRFPKPVIIERLDGGEVVLGTMADVKGNDEDQSR